MSRLAGAPREQPPPSADIVQNRYWVFTALFLVRAILNITAFALIFGDTVNLKSTKRDSADELEVYANATMTSRGKIGWYFLTASIILNYAMYVWHKHLLEKTDFTHSEIQPRIYTLAHISIVNFIVDFPGWYSASTQPSRWMVTVMNLTAGLILLFVLVVERPFELAWGCYPAKENSILDLKWGLCPTYFDNQEASFQPICDRPGVRCNEGLVLSKHSFEQAFNVAHVIVSASAAIFALSIPQKISFFQLAFEQAKQLEPAKNKRA